MGLFDGVKGEVQQQFVARPDSSKDLVLYKWPETNIRMLSVVTVQPDEWAYFIKQGQVAGYLQHDNKEETLRVYGETVMPALREHIVAKA